MGSGTDRIVHLAQLLQQLVLLFLSSDTVTNLPLRQCLSYFFPVYCYSSPLNQRRMQEVGYLAQRT
jgi:condensin complex subunit 3